MMMTLAANWYGPTSAEARVEWASETHAREGWGTSPPRTLDDSRICSCT